MSEEKIRYTVLPRTLVFVFKEDRLLMMRYPGKGTNQTQEKSERKDIYNPIGGHVEEGESVIDSAIKEAEEEAGIRLVNAKVKGIINVSGFAGKNIMNFVVTGTTDDEPIKTSLEGELEWVHLTEIVSLNVFPDLKPILEKLLSLEDDQMFVGVAQFDGKFDLMNIELSTV
jgi:8-oxo-dGTP diphosphatase